MTANRFKLLEEEKLVFGRVYYYSSIYGGYEPFIFTKIERRQDKPSLYYYFDLKKKSLLFLYGLSRMYEDQG